MFLISGLSGLACGLGDGLTNANLRFARRFVPQRKASLQIENLQMHGFCRGQAQISLQIVDLHLYANARR